MATNNFVAYFYGNGGYPAYYQYTNPSGITNAISVRIDTVYAPTKSGYQLDSYKTNRGNTFYNFSTLTVSTLDYESVTYDADTDTYTYSKTLTAQWNEITYTYTLTLDKNGGLSNKTKEKTVTTTSYDFTLSSSDTTTRSGYALQGWSDVIGASTPDYTLGDTVPMSYPNELTKTIYCVWATAYTYTLNLYPNYDSLSPVVHQAVNTSTSYNYTLQSTDKPTRTGYKFLGWSLSSSSQTASYQVGDTVQFRSPNYMTYNLYAIWEELPVYTYNLNLYVNDGTETYVNKPATSTDTTYTFTLEQTDVPTRAGYNFLGWSMSSSAIVPSYEVGDEVQCRYPNYMTANLYAVWEIPHYTVTYDGNPTTGTAYSVPESQTKYQDVTLQLSTLVPILSGYSFTSWNTSADGTGTSYSAGANYTANADVTLYAQWTARSLTKFYWDGNDGSTDATLIATGANVSNITANRWNDLLSKLIDMDSTFVPTTITSDEYMTATAINTVLTEIRKIATDNSITITIPNNVTAGDLIRASMFNGIESSVYSIKNAINYIIDTLYPPVTTYTWKKYNLVTTKTDTAGSAELVTQSTVIPDGTTFYVSSTAPSISGDTFSYLTNRSTRAYNSASWDLNLFTYFSTSSSTTGSIYYNLKGMDGYGSGDVSYIPHSITTTYSQGTYIEDVTSTDASAYPANNRQGNYWYVLQS